MAQQEDAGLGGQVFAEILKTGDLKSGQMRSYGAAGREILVARVGDRFFATDNRCPHFGGDLAAGRLEDTVVTCPRHGSQFDLRDGRVVRWTDWSGWKLRVVSRFRPPRGLTVHATKVEADRVLVEI